MRLNRQRTALALLIAISMLFSVGHAPAADSTASFFPILYWDKSDETLRFDLFAPLFTFQANKDRWSAALHPLFSIEKDRKSGTISLDFIYPFVEHRSKMSGKPPRSRSRLEIFPLFHWSSQHDGLTYKSLMIFPLIYWGSQGQGRNYFLLLPFFLYAHDAKIYVPYYAIKRQSFFSIFPLYGRFRDLPRRDRLEFFLWPLFILSRKDETKSFNFLYPFFNYITGGERKGVKIWPLFCYFRDADRALKIYYLWPLGHHYRTRLDTSNPQALDIFFPFFCRVRKENFTFDYVFPFYGRSRVPGETSSAYLWPLLSIWRGSEHDTRGFSILWQIFRYERGRDRWLAQLFPIAGKKVSPGRYRSYFLWFLYNHLIREDEESIYERRYLFPFYICKNKITKETGTEETRRIILPFFSYAKEKDASRKKSGLWLFWYDRSEGIERNWAPLWRIYESIKYPNGDFEKQYLWGLYRSASKDDIKKRELNLLLFHYRKDDEETQLNFLGGLLGFIKRPDGTKLKLLYSLF